MSRKWWAIIVVAVLAVAAVTVGIATSMAQGTTTLQSLSVAQLLAKVSDASKSTTAVSGDITWSNGLIPGSDLTGLLSGQSSAPTSLSGLALGGSGRLWLQQGSGLRLESQGSGSDFIVVAGKNGLWSYSSASSTATHYTPPVGASAKAPTSSPSPQPSSTDALSAITAGLQRFASTGTVTMGPQTTVAGQPSYLLVMTPASVHTTVGSVQVAIDAKTFVPLRVRVFAKGDTTATLSAGFTSVSYGHLGNSLFAFTAPIGATVRSQALPSPRGLLGSATATKPAAHQQLTFAAAKVKAAGYGLTLATPSAPPSDLPFTGAMVTAPSKARGATAVLHYGSGFGSVVVIESQGPSSQSTGLQQQIASLPRGLITAMTIAGAPGYELQTPLVNIAAWQHGTTTAVAAGLVPQTLFSQFLAAIH
jgi:outer membrane lipoprotein-sorting protein